MSLKEEKRRSWVVYKMCMKCGRMVGDKDEVCTRFSFEKTAEKCGGTEFMKQGDPEGFDAELVIDLKCPDLDDDYIGEVFNEDD